MSTSTSFRDTSLKNAGIVLDYIMLDADSFTKVPLFRIQNERTENEISTGTNVIPGSTERYFMCVDWRGERLAIIGIAEDDGSTDAAAGRAGEFTGGKMGHLRALTEIT
ncbi:hypothetical protein C0991_004420 [Blastosporella zonata]|nr:hypothetical protein C0991_004420 [Blastosporella zonata]